ncbi:hypothetical protein [Nitriliruptor alkaliphilus]|uniref:hypothetical protein n=1 Tax=Nitriliruptor alkaliphilus TaxID=427918 RepID=UPI0006975D77|nr:hypothetical protein [Nitriliruptor alkaliphilus]
MDLVRTDLALVALVAGAVVLAVATNVAMRHEPAVAGRRVGGLAPLVPWIGGLLVLVLLVRGSTAGAVVVGLATVVHAVVTRFRTVRRRR